MKICFIVNGYPTKEDPVYAFIRPVVVALSDLGNECTVISPQKIGNRLIRGTKRRPRLWYDCSKKGNAIPIFQPYMLSLSGIRLGETYVSTYFRNKAVERTLKRYKMFPDVLYGHFWEAAIGAAIASKGQIPVVAASGESTIWVKARYSEDVLKKYLPNIKGVICVSSKNDEESRSMGLLSKHPKTIILPNGYDSTMFYPMDRKKAREELGLPENAVIASFVGAFSERKGVKRVIRAAERIPALKLMLIGKGEMPEKSGQILFMGKLPHDEIGKYLSASDFFVLPTLHEGCCNAIIEALACGLPVISSDLDFNRDVLNNKNAILVPPENIDALAEAMETLVREEEKRKAMGKEAIKTAEHLTIEGRCDKIMDFIAQVISEK